MLCKHMMLQICAAALLGCAGAGAAQTIYKQMDDTGRAIYTDQPAPGGIVVSYEIFRSHERSAVAPPRAATGTRADVAKALLRNSPMSSTYAATVDFNEAGRRLRLARQSRLEGMELRPGERIDSVGTDAMDRRYQRRQQRLEREVVAAERRSHQTAVAWNAFLRRDGMTDPIKLAQP